jgi:alanyl-tRNA synthetase
MEAMTISGLRAVFGEVYPDPVRVLSIGPSVTELKQSPTAAHLHDFSIEFCGGTHLSNTIDAQAFVILGAWFSHTHTLSLSLSLSNEVCVVL